jgi:hypothetical protein
MAADLKSYDPLIDLLADLLLEDLARDQDAAEPQKKTTEGSDKTAAAA